MFPNLVILGLKFISIEDEKIKKADDRGDDRSGSEPSKPHGRIVRLNGNDRAWDGYNGAKPQYRIQGTPYPEPSACRRNLADYRFTNRHTTLHHGVADAWGAVRHPPGEYPIVA